jgi:TonB-linked SusC/RagA family outer membrane protein
MKKIRLLMAAVALVLSVGIASAQNVQVRGTVTDASNGEPVPFASVQVKGTMQGTASDALGNFTISAPASGSLVFSSIGYTTQEVAVNNRSQINVALAPEAEFLDDVVVVAYGTQSARTVTAAVASIKSDVLKDAPNVNFDAMLQGQASGVQVASPSGGAGAQAKVLIRGVSSISAGTDPLYIVDGIPVASNNLLATYTESNALSDINPADIESIEVLKDAAATALYGSRAASGVIIITTKQGRKGDTKVTYDMNIGFTQPTKMFDVMDADTYVAYKNQAVYNRYGTDERIISGGKNPYGDKAFNMMTDSKGNKIRTNWNDLIFKNGLIQNHTVAISGGSDRTQYYASANYSDNTGIIQGDRYHRYGIKANVSTQINKWLKLGLNTSYTKSFTQAADASRNGSVFAAAGLPRQAMIMPPILPAYNEDGSYYTMNNGQYVGVGGISIASLGYPNAMAQLESYNKVNTSRILASGFIDLTPIKNLTFRTQFGTDYMTEEEETFWHQNYGQGVNYNGYAYKTMSDMTNWTWTNTADYNLIFGNNSFNFLAGMEANERSYGYDYVKGEDVLNPAYTGFRAGYSEYEGGGTYGSRALISYFGRINYDYASKYMVSLNFRRDGLSALGANNKWGNFWGASAAWRVSEENFFSPLRDVIDEFKINASYGIVGNSEIGYYNAQTYYGDDVYGGLPALGLSNIGDSSLAWENSTKYDVGFSARLFNRLDVDFDWYYTKTNDLVLAVPQGPSTGIGSLTTNAGSLQNKGIELTLGMDIVRTRNFTWNSSFNITTAHNKVLSLAEGVDALYSEDVSVTLPGYSIGQIYAYPTGGIDPETGCRIFYGSNGEWTIYDPARGNWFLKDGSVFQGDIAPVRSGNTLPTWFGGWNNTFRYKGFDLNIFFQYSGGNWIMNANTASGSDNRWWNNFAEVAEKSWQKPGDNAKYARPYYGDNVSNGSAYDITDWIERGDYLRLKSVSLGYTYNTGSRKDILGFTSVRAYAQVQNAFVLTAFTGLDPEITSSYSSSPVLTSGYYKNTLPQARTYTLGLQLTF